MAATKPTPTVFDGFRKYESEISTVFGFVVVVLIGLGLLFFLRRTTLNTNSRISESGEQTSSEDLMKKAEQEKAAKGTYTVKSGDHLWKIAQDQMGDGYQWTTIAKANNVKAPYVVREGQTLTIPAADPNIKGKESTPVAKTEAPATPAPVQTSSSYTVSRGDNLWKIAVKEYKDGYKWVQIYNANKATIGKNPGLLKAGQKLTLPTLK